MSRDLPETFNSPHSMAKSLATYMTDPLKIRRVVMDNFFSAPGVSEIDELIVRHRRAQDISRKANRVTLIPRTRPQN